MSISDPAQPDIPPSSAGGGLDAAPVIERLATQAGVQRLPSSQITLFQLRHFLDPVLCTDFIDAIDAQRRPSTLADQAGDAGFRTSETCDFAPDDPLSRRVDALIADLTGLDPAYGEPLQGQRYAIGQEFKLHTDYFEPTGIDYERFCGVHGQRTWTLMVYLNRPKAGGGTRFKVIDKIFGPEPGKLLAWNNRRADGAPNPATIHAGLKVRAGTKYVLTKWFRERPWRS